MQVFRTATVEDRALEAGVRAKPTGLAAVRATMMDFARRKPAAAAGGAFLFFVIIVAIFAPWIAPHDPLTLQVAEKFSGPGTAGAILGTDHLGQDVLSRLIHGARVSMTVGVVSVMIGITAGTLIGIFSAYAGGKVDMLLQRLIDAMMGFPPIILALALMAALGGSTVNVIIALVAILMPGAARVIRSQALSIKELDYTLAARAIGASSSRIMLRHMLPNVAGTYIVLVTITLGFAIVVEATLSFLGVGVPSNTATWGSMLDVGRKNIDIQHWLVVFPGIAIATVVFAVNFLGDGLRDYFDPRLRGR